MSSIAEEMKKLDRCFKEASPNVLGMIIHQVFCGF
jgi:hypothetical protein